MEAVRTSETLVDNYFTRQYIPEDNSEQVNNFGNYICGRTNILTCCGFSWFRRTNKQYYVITGLNINFVF
jgi:hypothetical protein